MDIHQNIDWSIHNLKFLMIKITGLIIRIAPFKVHLINTLGFFLGLIDMCLKSNKWKAIAAFARQSGSTLPGWLFLLKYFIQRGEDRIWSSIVWEVPNFPKKYITVENKELLDKTIKDGKGAILVGAHYGPLFYTYFFREINFNVKILASKKFLKHLHNSLELGINFLISKRVLFLTGTQSYVVAQPHRSEKEFVPHIKKGGVVLIINDIYFTCNENENTGFFGFPGRFSYFPFRLGLRYNVPIFFCFFNKAQNGGYCLNFTPSGDFSAPEEGAKKYASFLQKQITTYPFMWGMNLLLRWRRGL